MQSGHTHLPARSKLCRIFGSSMHQQWSLPGGAPQLKDVPHSSQTSLFMSASARWIQKPAPCQTIMQALWNRCRSGPAVPDTIFLSLSGKAVLSLCRCEHGGIGRHTRLKILRPNGRGGSSPPARTSRIWTGEWVSLDGGLCPDQAAELPDRAASEIRSC